MSYKYTFNSDRDYLIHFNKNHSKANGQFISGDGDDDGIIDDHHNYSRNKKGDTSGSNVSDAPKKKGVFSDSGRGRALKKGIIATTAVVGAVATLAAVQGFVNSKRNESPEPYFGSRYFNDGKSFVDDNGYVFNNMYEKIKNAKSAGGDW